MPVPGFGCQTTPARQPQQRTPRQGPTPQTPPYVVQQYASRSPTDDASLHYRLTEAINFAQSTPINQKPLQPRIQSADHFMRGHIHHLADVDSHIAAFRQERNHMLVQLESLRSAPAALQQEARRELVNLRLPPRAGPSLQRLQAGVEEYRTKAPPQAHPLFDFARYASHSTDAPPVAATAPPSPWNQGQPPQQAPQVPLMPTPT